MSFQNAMANLNSAMQVPVILLCQAGSPAVLEGHDGQIEGAMPGRYVVTPPKKMLLPKDFEFTVTNFYNDYALYQPAPSGSTEMPKFIQGLSLQQFNELVRKGKVQSVGNKRYIDGLVAMEIYHYDLFLLKLDDIFEFTAKSTVLWEMQKFNALLFPTCKEVDGCLITNVCTMASMLRKRGSNQWYVPKPSISSAPGETLTDLIVAKIKSKTAIVPSYDTFPQKQERQEDGIVEAETEPLDTPF